MTPEVLRSILLQDLGVMGVRVVRPLLCQEKPAQRARLAPSISPDKWQVPSVRERPPVPGIVRWTMPQVYRKDRVSRA
jgi:hypothetical protein